ncbi:MAG: hypothetical protein AB1700_04145 [Bacillota bacterium]|jgi:hypothetical protein
MRRKLFSRLDALRNGDPEVDRLLDTAKDVLDRYIFISAYVAAKRDSSEFPKLILELLETEDSWAENTDPDVLALFEACKANCLTHLS